MRVLKALLVISMLCIAIPTYAISFSLNGSVEIREIIEQNQSTPHQKTLEELRLTGALDLATWLRCNGSFFARNYGGISRHSQPSIEHQWSTFQNGNPLFEFEEAYCKISQSYWDVSIGKQKFAWGKLDSYQPNDLLNSERFIDPFLDDENKRKIGTPAVSINIYPTYSWLPEESKLTLVWKPLHTPARFFSGERWFPPAANVGNLVSIPSGTITMPDGSYAPTFSVPIKNRLDNNTRSFRFNQSALALRASTLIGVVDTAFYYYHGIDPEPTFELDAVVSGMPDQSASSPLGIKNLVAVTTLRPSFHTIDSVGVDMAYPWEDFTFRAEGAYIRGRAFNREFSSVLASRDTISSFGLIANALHHRAGSVAVPITSYALSDVIEWGVGGDFVRDNGMVLLQANQSALLNPTASDLLVSPVETRILLNAEKEFSEYHVTAKFVAVHAIESDYTVLLPRVSYEVLEGLKLEVGYLMIAGRTHSIIGQYNDRDQAFVRALYSF